MSTMSQGGCFGWRAWRKVGRMLVIFILPVSGCAMAQVDPATALREKYVSLTQSLEQNSFKRPLVLNSTETAHELKGNVYATINYPFEQVNASLNNPNHWCEVMLLHINIKYCRAVAKPSGTIFRINVGKKTPEKLVNTARIEFKYQVRTTTPEYVEIRLNAKEGPMGTSNYRMVFEAVALGGDKTFLHLSYSYAMNFTGRLAMQFYLETLGAGKVGFTVIGKRANGQLDYIDGLRGLVERNTMRYYLAIDAFLGATGTDPALQFEKRLQNWFAATEQYPRQLHEMNRSAYLNMKRSEYARQKGD